MAGLISSRVRTLMTRILERYGYRVVNGNLPWATPGFAYRAVRACNPDMVLDVGANTGQFGHSLRAAGYAGPLVSFEPQAAAFAALSEAAKNDPAWECHRLALGASVGRLEMHISAFSPSSSLLPIGTRHIELFPFTAESGSEEVEVARLDDWMASRPVAPEKLFVKIDTQGYESQVLAGADRTLAVAAGVLVELNFADLFDGQSKYYEVTRVLEELGLRLFTLLDVSLAPEHHGYLWGDGLFLRSDAAANLAGGRR